MRGNNSRGGIVRSERRLAGRKQRRNHLCQLWRWKLLNFGEEEEISGEQEGRIKVTVEDEVVNSSTVATREVVNREEDSVVVEVAMDEDAEEVAEETTNQLQQEKSLMIWIVT